jgi:Icc-related predicted phosphoesterase
MSTKQKRVRVAALSDLHCGKTSQGAYQSLFSQANERADVLLVCGDLTDHGLPEEAQVLYPARCKLRLFPDSCVRFP